MLLKPDEPGSLAPIEVVMLHEVLIYEAVGVLATFERKAGNPFPNHFTFPLLKKIQLFN